jgi:hypothetical protein
VTSSWSGTTRGSATSIVLGFRAAAYTLVTPRSMSWWTNSRPRPRFAGSSQSGVYLRSEAAALQQ